MSHSRSTQRPLAINERRGDLEAQLINRQNLGLVAQLAGSYGEALERFTAAAALAEGHAGEPWAPCQRRLARLNQGVVLELAATLPRPDTEALFDIVSNDALQSGNHLFALTVARGVAARREAAD